MVGGSSSGNGSDQQIRARHLSQETFASRKTALIGMTLGAMLISTTAIFVKWAEVAPSVSAFKGMLFGGLMLWCLLRIERKWHPVAAKDLAWLILPDAAFAVDLLFWHRSIAAVGPGLATLLANFQVFIMAAAGVIFFRERLSFGFCSGLVFALLGLCLLIGPSWHEVGIDYRVGVLFGLLTGLAYAAYLLSMRYVQNLRVLRSPRQLLCTCSLLSALLLAAEVLFEGSSFTIPNLQSWVALLSLGLVGQVLGWVLIVRAMPKLPASLVGLLLLLQPSLSFLLDVLLFGRWTSGIEWLGFSLSLAGIFVGSQLKTKSA